MRFLWSEAAEAGDLGLGSEEVASRGVGPVGAGLEVSLLAEIMMVVIDIGIVDGTLVHEVSPS